MTDLAEDPLPVGANHDPGIEFAPDSPLEGDGFEPSVPRSGSRREARLTVSPITVKDGASVEPIVAHNGNLWRVGGDWFFHSALCWMTEFAGRRPVSLAEAQPLVPAGYVIAGAAMGQAATWSARRADRGALYRRISRVVAWRYLA